MHYVGKSCLKWLKSKIGFAQKSINIITDVISAFKCVLHTQSILKSHGIIATFSHHDIMYVFHDIIKSNNYSLFVTYFTLCLFYFFHYEENQRTLIKNRFSMVLMSITIFHISINIVADYPP